MIRFNNPFVRLGAVVISSFIIGATVGWVIPHNSDASVLTEKSVRLSGVYPLISPLLLCGSNEPKDLGDYKSLNADLLSSIADAKLKNTVSSASVYFRRSTQWIGINENDKYAPASLLKVPVMIAYFSEAENDPAVLKEKVF